jgi:hypothetical protein
VLPPKPTYRITAVLPVNADLTPGKYGIWQLTKKIYTYMNDVLPSCQMRLGIYTAREETPVRGRSDWFSLALAEHDEIKLPTCMARYGLEVSRVKLR